MPKEGGTKVGNYIRKKRTQFKQWKKDNPKTSEASGRFGKSMSESSQEMASSGGGSETVYKGHIVASLVNENDLRKIVTTEVEDLLATKQELSYEPYEEWSKSKKDIIT